MRQLSLLYHDVVGGSPADSGFPGADADSYKLGEALFRAHLDRVAEAGGDRVAVVPRTGGSPSAQLPIHLTFDDGGVTAHEPTARLLEAHGFRGHFFIVTERVDQPGFLSKDQIRDLYARGHDIGSHSHSHPSRFSELGYGKILFEWFESRRILTEILGEAPYTASVPGGFYSADVARAAQEAGYRVLFNSEPTTRVHRLGDLAILGRYGIKNRTSAEQAQALARGDLAPRAGQTLLWNAKKPLKKVGGPVWHQVRRWFFERTSS